MALLRFLLFTFFLAAPLSAQDGHVLTARGEKLYLDDREFLVKGLRTSNALISDAKTDELVEHMDTFAAYGVNTFGVYFMGSRFGDVKGYRPDATIDPVYGARMERIIRKADARAMVVLVGALYWSNSKAKHEHWTQADAERAIANTVLWLRERKLRNVFVDIDNEGMAEGAKGFDPEALVSAAKAADPSYLIALNSRRGRAPSADLHIHHAPPVPGKPYVESEGTAREGAPGGYWGAYSKRPGLYNYINVGVHSEEYQRAQQRITREHLARGHGYMMASTWLQAVPPLGPNHRPGGTGTPEDPGIRWWLEFLRSSGF
jgi:hypothetical protein